MVYRNIYIANPARIRFKMNQLEVDNGEVLTFPIEDICCVLVDNEQTVLSARLISSLAENGVCLIIADNKHMPVAQLVPVGVYCRVNKRIKLQIDQSKPKLKRIWQKIVTRKIENQSLCLDKLGIPEAERLLAISKEVQSGDTNNREGYAASIYFKSLFGKEFSRNDENGINAALNYGYAIIRAYISKSLVAYGLEPSLGICHKNSLNAFCLSDDVIEPFRPIVDLYVTIKQQDWEGEFSTAQKAELLQLLNVSVQIGEEHTSVSRAIELMIQSLIKTFEGDEIDIKMPSLDDISYVDYE